METLVETNKMLVEVPVLVEEVLEEQEILVEVIQELEVMAKHSQNSLHQF